MADYGTIIYNEFGQTRLSISTKSFRLITMFIIAANASGSRFVPGLSDSREVVVLTAPYNAPIKKPGTPATSMVGPDYFTTHKTVVNGNYIQYSPPEKITDGTDNEYAPGKVVKTLVWVYATA